MNRTNERVVTLAIMVVMAVLLPAIIHGDYSLDESNPYRDFPSFLYHFQATLAGSLAVVAGYMTVRQMRLSDQLSEVRHQSLINLSLRADRLRFERLYIMNRHAVESAAREIRSLSVPSFQVEDHQAQMAFVRNTREFPEKANEVRDKISKQWNEAHWKSNIDLFDGALTNIVVATATALDEWVSASTNIQRFASRYVIDVATEMYWDGLRKDYDDIVKDFENKAWAASMLLDETLAGLDQVAALYGVAYWVGPVSVRTHTRKLA